MRNSRVKALTDELSELTLSVEDSAKLLADGFVVQRPPREVVAHVEAHAKSIIALALSALQHAAALREAADRAEA